MSEPVKGLMSQLSSIESFRKEARDRHEQRRREAEKKYASPRQGHDGHPVAASELHVQAAAAPAPPSDGDAASVSGSSNRTMLVFSPPNSPLRPEAAAYGRADGEPGRGERARRAQHYGDDLSSSSGSHEYSYSRSHASRQHSAEDVLPNSWDAQGAPFQSSQRPLRQTAADAVAKLEREAASKSALVAHTESVAASFLKEVGVKLSNRKHTYTKSTWRKESYEKGQADAKEIDINQRSLKGGGGGGGSDHTGKGKGKANLES